MSAFSSNPFRNWPFASSPGQTDLVGEPRACDCDVIDGKHYPSNGGLCPAGVYRHYLPPGLESFSSSSQQPFGHTNTRTSDQKSIDKKPTAIDSLKAVKSQRATKPPQMHTHQNPPGKENVLPAASRNDSGGARNMGGHSMQQTTGGAESAHAEGRMTRQSAQENFDARNLHDLLRDARLNDSPEAHKHYQTSTSTKLSSLTGNLGQSIDPSKLQLPKGFAPVTHGKMVLGCSQCLFNPALKVISCGCQICSDCGGRFWGNAASGAMVFCGCGERVTSVQALQAPNVRPPPGLSLATLGLPPGLFPQTPVYSQNNFSPSPQSAIGTGVPSLAHQFPSPTSTQDSPIWKRDQQSSTAQLPLMPPPMGSPVHLAGISPMINMQPNVAGLNKMLMMDADTAIQNAPFVELGRTALAQNWSCIKIGNIPYNVTSEELLDFLGRNSNIVPERAGSIGVHVIMDRSTGKTMDAYAEFLTSSDARKCLSRRRSRVLGNRHLTMELVDAGDLMKDIFPRAKGITWESVAPKVIEREDDQKIEIISREELVLIVNHARTPHRSPFSRKCLQRPFQSLMSIVSKFPWFAISIYTIQQRDYIFHALLTAVDILKRQIKRGGTMPNLDIDLLKSLLRVGLRCAGFTDAQKYELVKTAEFGAEGIQVDADIGILSGFEALGKAVGAERKVLEFYALLLELSVSPFVNEPSTQGNAAAELIRAKQITKQHPEESKKSHLTMAEAAALEWATIEKAVRSVLPAKPPYAAKSAGLANIGGWRDTTQQ